MTNRLALGLLAAMLAVTAAGRSHADTQCPPASSSTTTTEPKLIIEPPHLVPPSPPTTTATLPVTQ